MLRSTSAQPVALSAGLVLVHDTVLLVSQSTPLSTKQCTVVKPRKRQEVLRAAGEHSSVLRRHSKPAEVALPGGEGAAVTTESREQGAGTPPRKA